MSFFDTEELLAVMLDKLADRDGLPSPSRDRDGIGRRNDTGICSCFAPSWVCVALNKAPLCQV